MALTTQAPIDRARFLKLTAALATAACSPAAARPVEVIVPAALAAPAPLAPAPDPSAVVADVPVSTCDDSQADLSACSRIGPSCEGMADECDSLTASPAEGFQPRVAEKIANCWADSKMGRSRCRAPSMAKCIRDAIDSTCIPPGIETSCDSIFAECARAGAKPSYTKTQCAKMLASVVGSSRDDAVRALGPAAEGRCSTDYALPYYPYSRSMWK